MQRQLHELQLQVQHFQQLQLDSNRMADLNKELLVQQNQIDGLQRQLEEKKTQEQARIREHEQSRLKLENTIIELQKQLQHEQHHHSELKRSVEQERFISEQSRVISQKHEELKLKEKELTDKLERAYRQIKGCCLVMQMIGGISTKWTTSDHSCKPANVGSLNWSNC